MQWKSIGALNAFLRMALVLASQLSPHSSPLPQTPQFYQVISPILTRYFSLAWNTLTVSLTHHLQILPWRASSVSGAGFCQSEASKKRFGHSTLMFQNCLPEYCCSSSALTHLLSLKVIAAKRAGVRTVVLPNDNRKDFDDLPDLIKADVEVHFAENYDQVFKIAFSEAQK